MIIGFAKEVVIWNKHTGQSAIIYDGHRAVRHHRLLYVCSALSHADGYFIFRVSSQCELIRQAGDKINEFDIFV